ncbi:MAG: hypothetical protein K0B87_00625 [Candidatus Syntrophosphaera sp.]|nr:hypothetical protein [Candidatus Syntrophosphaera sp.]
MINRPRAALAILALLSLAGGTLNAQGRLLFAEAQAVGSWESPSNSFRPYSMHPDEAMQKPSLGFDLVQRLGGEGRDWGYLAVQARLAYDENRPSRLEPQLYNAFLNFKAPGFDAWIGHNKPALGLSLTLDNHAQILMDNTMSGLVMDRDWGLGLNFNRGRPELAVSLTTGSGMALAYDESWLLAARAGLGEHSRENIALGASLAAGTVFKTMGYHFMHDLATHRLLLGGIDFSRRITAFELRSDLLYGSFHENPAYAALARLTWFPLPEDRAEITLQGQFQELAGAAVQNYSLGAGYRLSPDLALRSAFTYSEPAESGTIALQLYYYKALPF